MSEKLPTELDKLLQTEHDVLQQNRSLLGEEALQVCELIENAYSFLIDCFSALAVNEVQTVLLQFIAGSKMQVATGFASLLRGQEVDSQSNLRKAIEHVLFAVNLFERPQSAEKWLYFSRSQKAYSDYRREFNIVDMLHISTYETLSDIDCQFLQLLIERYETCCLSVHPTPLAQGSKLSTILPDGKLGICIYLVDQFSDSQLRRRYFSDCDTHVLILILFAMTVERAEGSFDRVYWSGLMDELNSEKSKLYDVLCSDIKPLEVAPEWRAFWQLTKSHRRKSGYKNKSQQPPSR